MLNSPLCRFAQIIALFLFWMTNNGAYGDEVATCSQVKGLASGQVAHLCGCTSTQCTACNYFAFGSATVVCTNGCQYCAYGVCAEYFGAVTRSDERASGLALVFTFGFGFEYTKGRSGAFAYASGGLGCSASFNNVRCSCTLNYCDAGRTTTGGFVDCSNIQAGATANLCSPSTNFGITSTDHLLIGLLVDASDPCNNPPTKAPVKAPIKAPVKAPVKIPVKAPVKVPVKRPVKLPVKTPVKVPVKTPVKVPVKTPVKTPVRTPAK